MFKTKLKELSLNIQYPINSVQLKSQRRQLCWKLLYLRSKNGLLYKRYEHVALLIKVTVISFSLVARLCLNLLNCLSVYCILSSSNITWISSNQIMTWIFNQINKQIGKSHAKETSKPRGKLPKLQKTLKRKQVNK
jgi:hypothetical protein